MNNLLESAYSALLHAAGYILAEGCAGSRAEDPHRFVTLAKEFDGGKAAPRLQIDYLPDGEVQISHVLIGQAGGEMKQVAVFTTSLRPKVEH